MNNPRMAYVRCRTSLAATAMLPGFHSALLWGFLIGISWVLFVAAAAAQDPPHLVASTDPLPPQEQQQLFRLPEGFRIELVASEPDIHKPMNLNFDAQGRLYVTSSVEYPFPAPDDRPARDALLRLEGRPLGSRVVTIVERLNIPIGVTPTAEGVLFHSIPRIYAVAAEPGQSLEQARPLYGDIGFRDTHGMANSFTRWLDGWIYACHGFANDSELKSLGGSVVRMHSGNTFRMAADGSRLEQFTHGQVNPFGLAFDPWGNLYSADCHSRPIYQLLRGAWYPSFGKPHDGLGFGPEMIAHDHGSTGIAGVVYYAADQFPPEYRGTIFIGNPVTGRVNHDRLEHHGSSPHAVELPDFLSCDDPWFRPVDLKLGPDGALYIADFYNCIIGHYEVPLTHPRRDRERGRIWKVYYVGDGRELPEIEDLTQLDIEQLGERLGSSNLTVRLLATEVLAARGQEGFRLEWLIPEQSEPAVYRRAHALWIAERVLPGGLADELLAPLLTDAAALVRVHALKALAERAAWESRPIDWHARVAAALTDSEPLVRRAAADALGRHPRSDHLPELLKLWIETPPDDTHLIHVVRMALRDQLRLQESWATAATLAADASLGERLMEVSLGVHNAQAAEFLFAQAASRGPEHPLAAPALQEAARWLPEAHLRNLYAHLLHLEAPPNALHQVLLAVHRGVQQRGGTLPAELLGLASRTADALLCQPQIPAIQQGLELVREMRLAPLWETLAELAGAGSAWPELRPVALDTCLAVDAERTVAVAAAVLAGEQEPLAMRQKAAAILGGIGTYSAAQALLAQLPTAPEAVAAEIAFALAVRNETAAALLELVAVGKAPPRLLQEPRLVERLARSGVPDLQARLEQLTASLPPADERLRLLVEARRVGYSRAKTDQEAGRTLFKKHCAACHRLGSEGNKIGPDLDGVGLRGLDRLVEDVLDPNRNVDQAFRSTLIHTVDGRVLQGLVLREEGEVLVIADEKGQEQRLRLEEIDKRMLTQQSPMPANVAELVPEAEFYHLLAWLLAQRGKAQAELPK